MQDNQRLDAKKKHNFSDHELVAAFIEKRLSDNLAALKKYLPDLYQRFNHYQEKKLFLIYDADGNINLFDKEEGSTLYGDNPVQQCLNNLSEYIKSPVQRPYFIAAKKNKEGEEKTQTEKIAYVHSASLYKIGLLQTDLLINQAQRSLSTSTGGSSESVSDRVRKAVAPDSLPHFINYLFCFSVGLGFDFEKLYSDFDIKNICLVEPDEDVFYASLQLTDWVSIFEKSIEKDFRIEIIVHDNEESLLSDVSAVVNTVGRHNVAGAYFYSAFYRENYGEIFQKVKDAINYSYLNGFGFYDDSRNSLAHTFANAKNNIPLMASNKALNKKLGQEKLPVMIIGNGPSLDNDLDYIAEHQKEFLIVSCGSALRTLLRNNIQPDFHAELERTASVPLWIEKSAEGIDNFYEKLQKITLLHVSQVHPRVATLFGRAGMVLKDIETGSSFIHHSLKGKGVALLTRLAPSCVHTGITITAMLGFREFYLFGTDMGSANPDRHHSEDSSYQFADQKKLSQKFDFKKNGVIFKSNFGDKDIYSSHVYPMFKRQLESVIQGWNYTLGGIKVYNCSDGALLEGTEPKYTSDIILTERFDNDRKKEVVDQVFNAFFSFYPADYIETLDQSLENVKSAVDKAADSASAMIYPVYTIEEALKLADRFTLEFHSVGVLEDSFAWVYSVFDGSLLYMLSTITSTAMLPCDESLKLKALNKQFEELKNFFSAVKNDFREHALTCDKDSNYDLFVEESKKEVLN